MRYLVGMTMIVAGATAAIATASSANAATPTRHLSASGTHQIVRSQARTVAPDNECPPG